MDPVKDQLAETSMHMPFIPKEKVEGLLPNTPKRQKPVEEATRLHWSLPCVGRPMNLINFMILVRTASMRQPGDLYKSILIWEFSCLGKTGKRCQWDE